MKKIQKSGKLQKEKMRKRPKVRYPEGFINDPELIGPSGWYQKLSDKNNPQKSENQNTCSPSGHFLRLAPKKGNSELK